MTIDVKRIQARLLEMAITIRDILEKESIKYMITFGTLLGAIRHKGFIPWDDDFDFFLFQEDYDKALEVLRRDLPEDMFLEDEKSEPLYFHSWAHVKDMNSEALCEQFPQDNIYAHKGVSIDLYVTVEMDERDIDLYRLQENLLYRQRLLKSGVIEEKQYLKMKEEIENRIDLEKKKISGKPPKGKELAMSLNERMMYRDDVFPLRRYEFENTDFWGPYDADAVLTGFYGDYMTLPPEEKRIAHYNRVLFKTFR